MDFLFFFKLGACCCYVASGNNLKLKMLMPQNIYHISFWDFPEEKQMSTQDIHITWPQLAFL